MNFSDLIRIFLCFGVLTIAKSDTQSSKQSINNVSPDAQTGFSPLSPPFPSAIEKSNLNLLDNGEYDPTLYQNYLPNDVVQQYVSTFGGQFPPTAYSAGYDSDNNGYRVENGFEGYLVPHIPGGGVGGIAGGGSYADLDDYINLPQGLIPVLGSLKGPEKTLAPALKTVLSPFGLEWLVSLIPLSLFAVIPVIFGIVLKIGSVLIGAAAVAGIGGLIMHLICSVTSVCSLTLNKLTLPFLKWTEGVKSNVKNKIAHTIETVAETVDHVNHHIAEAGNSAENTIHSLTNEVAAKVANKVAEAAEHLDLTPDRIKRATEFVMSAIKKYEELQKAGEIESIAEIIDHIAE